MADADWQTLDNFYTICSVLYMNNAIISMNAITTAYYQTFFSPQHTKNFLIRMLRKDLCCSQRC